MVFTVQRTTRPQQAIQGAHASQQPLMVGVRQQTPIKRFPVAPFMVLAELAPHEQQLLAGCGPLVGQHQTQARALLPFITVHLLQQRTLSVNHLVMRQRQQETLRPRIHETESDERMCIATEQGIGRHITQRVVHPAHIPLERETETTLRHGARDASERRGFLGGRQDAWK